MPKKTAKQKKKDRKQPAELKPPAFLLPTSPAKPTASTSDREIVGLPKTPRHESGNALESFAAVSPAVAISSGGAEPMDIAVGGRSATEVSSTQSSPPHDAAAVLAALASKSPRQPSPRPPASPQPPSTHTVAGTQDTSPSVQVRHTRLDSHHRQGSEASVGRTSTMRSASPGAAPTLVRSGKGIAFMPSASHFLSAQPTIDTGKEITSSSPRPQMSRTASGAAREIVQGDTGKGVGRSRSHGSLRSRADGPSVQRSNKAETEVDEDPISEAQVDEMVKRGKIQVGVVPDAPEAVISTEEGMDVASEAREADDDAGDEDAAVGAEQNDRSPADHIPWAPLPPHESKRSTKDAPKSPSIVPQKRDADDVQHEEDNKHAGHPGLRSKKRSFLKLPSTDHDAKPDSEDERVLNEVSKDGASAPESELLSRSSSPLAAGPTERDERDEKELAETQTPENDDPTVYHPPYKTRRPYKPVPLGAFSEFTEHLTVSVFAAVTRHHEVPYAASRRLEVRLAWTEPSTWAWVPGGKYIPAWTVDYTARRVEDGIVRKTVKGVLGHTPVLWRLADWIR